MSRFHEAELEQMADRDAAEMQAEAAAKKEAFRVTWGLIRQVKDQNTRMALRALLVLIL